MRIIGPLLVFLLLASTLLSQDPAYINYSAEDGLPSSEVYDVIQDDEGYMWFATDRGVARFDGYEFEVFTVENGLVDNVVFNFFKDEVGRIWFLSYSAKLAYWYEGKIHKHPYNDILTSNCSGPIYFFMPMRI